MYIKAENRNKNDNSKIHGIMDEDQNKENTLQNIITAGTKSDEFENYIKENLRSNLINKTNFLNNGSNNQERNETQVYSLNFLHKPKRVSKLKYDRFPEEILQRNTDLNKQIPIELPPLSPKSSVNSSSSNNSSANNSSNNLSVNTSFFNNSSTESLLFNGPVYKKSGELVKPSLKRRSKSLPSTHALKEDKPIEHDEERPRVLIRSKSVHFDQRAPNKKYFRSDESPMNVYSKDEFDTMTAELTNSSNSSINDSDEDRLLNLGLTHLHLGHNHNKNYALQPSRKRNEKTLRKSKRFQNDNNRLDKMEKNTISAPSHNILHQQPSDPYNLQARTVNTSKFLIKKTIDDIRIPYKNEVIAKKFNSDKLKTNKVVGLYNKNFSILSNKNPKSLKLNIFVSLSQDKKAFLQELTLHVHQRNFTSLTAGPLPTTRYIIGKVLVKNIFYDKRVVVRYTWDNWRTVNEVECLWLCNGDGILPGTQMDIFHFLIDETQKADNVGQLEFCIHYTTRNDNERQEYWDNNDGKNYKVDVITNGFNNPFGY